MKTIFVFTAVLMLAFLSANAQTETEEMIHVQFRFSSTAIQEGSFQAMPRQAWRYSNTCVRMEESPDSANGIHGMMIINEPDAWMINRFTNEGLHQVDPGPTYIASCPLFPMRGLGPILELEVGREREFFDSRGAEELPEATIDGVECRVQHLVIDSISMSLYTQKEGGNPVQVTLSKGEFNLAAEFDIYETGLPLDTALFKPPAGAAIQEAK